MHALLKATVKFWCVLLLSFLNENKENMTNECLNSVLHTSGKGKKIEQKTNVILKRTPKFPP